MTANQMPPVVQTLIAYAPPSLHRSKTCNWLELEILLRYCTYLPGRYLSGTALQHSHFSSRNRRDSIIPSDLAAALCRFVPYLHHLFLPAPDPPQQITASHGRGHGLPVAYRCPVTGH